MNSIDTVFLVKETFFFFHVNLPFQVCKELWVCANGTVTSLEGGIEEYKKLVLKELADAAAK